MKIISIEPTPSPNVMKLNLDVTLPTGISYNFTRAKMEGAPEHIQRLFAIDGVVGVFQVLNFISLERHPKADWQTLLVKAREVLGEGASGEQKNAPTQPEGDSSFGEVKVFVQKLKGIPYQIKLVKEGAELRLGLPDRFKEAVMKVQATATNLIVDRVWEEQGVRYGELQEVAEQVAEEINAAYDDTRLQFLMQRALTTQATDSKGAVKEAEITIEELRQAFTEADWEKRYAALERWEPSFAHIDVLDQALKDPKTAIRRLAIVYLGFLEEKEAIPYLIKGLSDPSAVVRRTAGDCLSDKGDPAAIPAMCQALKDPNKLVRWRAARFLYEVGDESAIDALQEAIHDSEFEVKLQASIALERIQSGEEASGTVWQQMTRGMEKE